MGTTNNEQGQQEAVTGERADVTQQAQALTRDWNQKTRLEQIIARHEVWGMSGLPNSEYTASFADVEEFIRERNGLRRLLRAATSPTKCYCEVMAGNKCWHCEARAALNEQGRGQV